MINVYGFGQLQDDIKVQQAFLKQHHVRLVRYPNHSQIEFSKLAL